ncbi:MAG: PEP-CTERM sorting domain-containing protein [Aliifodinibius sp.]|nr:PEP-CTERM sorting domain-containing protein [Fodinibius sp.]NIV15462.1 PEP-CTERM sorting domain-containing protein [Fodinibius sp.]NIY29316.1 PEP-CTERM sorting domain-containing protein [Fodinibius sp.]
MMKNIALFVLALLGGCILCSTCEAMPITLGEIQYDGRGGASVIVSAVEFSWTDHGPTKLLDWGVVTPSDVGETFTQSPVTSPNFDFFASLLTSGTDDILCIQIYFPDHSYHGRQALESYWFNKFIQTENVDFYGWQVTEISLTVNSLTIDTPGRNPNGDGIWTDCAYDVTFTIYGIPEPATVLLLAFGSLFLARKRR